jgi:hypothetical protein
MGVSPYLHKGKGRSGSDDGIILLRWCQPQELGRSAEVSKQKCTTAHIYSRCAPSYFSFRTVLHIYLLLLILPFVLGPLAYFPSEFIWNYGSYRHLVGLLGRRISPVARPLHTQDNTNRRNADGHPCRPPCQCLSGRRHFVP